MLVYFCLFWGLIIFYTYIRKEKVSLKISRELFEKIILILFTLNLVAFGIEFSERLGGKDGTIKQIQRNSYDGFTKKETYQVQVGDEEEEIEVQISPRIYSKEQVELLYSKAMEELDKIILDQNESSDHITRNLVLPSELEEFPFSITWELSRYDVMNLQGELIRDEIIENDSENKGVSVTVTGVLVYENYEQKYQIELLVFADEAKEETDEAIQRIVQETDENSREEEYLLLPDTWDGETLIWKAEEENTGGYILIFGLVICVLLVFDEKQKQIEYQKKRKEEMLFDYPEIISQFTMLSGAGMTTKNIWKKIAEDYKRQKEHAGCERAAYEEILYTWKEMQSGVPEVECYERFGRRCELLPYMKMGALLAQNLRKGTKGVAEVLRMEALVALEERKSRVKRLGEEAGTKLLIPMVIMLAVVLAIVVIPAFWSTSM